MGLGKSLFERRINWKLLLFIFLLLDAAIFCLFLMMIWSGKAPAAAPERLTSNIVVAVTVAVTPLPPDPTQTPSPARPTPTGTRVVNAPSPTATRPAAPQPTPQVTVFAHLQTLRRRQTDPAAGSAGKVSFKRASPIVLAHYFAWFDGDGWDNCNISAGDKPLQPYHSDDPAAIARHVQLARSIGLNGFTLHWFAPGDRTDQNFQTLLTESQGSNFASTVVFSYHIWHGLAAPNRQTIGQALRYIIEQPARHPNFLRLEDKPVIFFTDVYRTPEQPPQAFWAAIRAQVDPERQTIWIAEGLDASYLDVFDGLYVFKISHAAYPHDYQKSPRWGRQVRRWADQTGQPKLWAATISPGWDDLRSGCRPDVRIANTPHRLERADGAIYEATFQAAMESRPDWLIVSSFNEWVEGSYIEPGERYGDRYMRLTAELIRRFQER